METLPDRIKLHLQFDVQKMQNEVQKLIDATGDFVYYSVIQLKAPAHLVDPNVPFPTASEHTNYADGSWTPWLETKALKKSPYLKSIVDAFAKHTDVSSVRLLRLGAGEVVKEHNDPTLGLEVSDSVVRLTIPIISNDDVVFYLNGLPTSMKLGECWYLQLSRPHKIVNGGLTERVHLTLDVIPNEWVRSKIVAGLHTRKDSEDAIL